MTSKSISEVSKIIDAIEEKYFVAGAMSKETFDKFYSRYKQQEPGQTHYKN
jgi:hypothetical protein